MKWLRVIVLIKGMLLPFLSITQPFNIPLNQTFQIEYEKSLLKDNNRLVGSFKPVIFSQNEGVQRTNFDSLLFFNKRRKDKSFVARKLFHEHFIALDTGIIHLSIDPLLNLELGEELEEDPRNINLYKNTRGFNIKLGVGEKVAIESSFRENQANLPLYLNERTKQTQVAYGQGRVKTFNEVGFDFSMSSAYISYSPLSNINIQAGHGKHFIGSGHRSLLLSDLSFNYPFLRINTSWFEQKLHYHNLFASLQDLNRLASGSLSEGLFERKQAAFHYLEYRVGEKLNVGLFEGTIFPSIDSSGNHDAGLNYWVPIIFLNSLIEAPDRNGNSLLGMNIEFQLAKRFRVYQQFSVFDENFESLGFQSGIKWFASSKLFMQIELNNINHDFIDNEYHHNNESLAHPIQAEVLEALAIFQFKHERWLTRLSNHYIDLDGNEIMYFDFRQSFIVNPSNLMSLNLGVQYRDETIENGTNQSTYLYFGLSTNLQNLYFNY